MSTMKEKLIKIENDRKEINKIKFLTEQEIETRILEISEIDNGDFYKRYKNLLTDELIWRKLEIKNI